MTRVGVNEHQRGFTSGVSNRRTNYFLSPFWTNIFVMAPFERRSMDKHQDNHQCQCTHHECLDQATAISSRASSRMCQWHHHSVVPCVKLRASSRTPMERMVRERSPNDVVDKNDPARDKGMHLVRIVQRILPRTSSYVGLASPDEETWCGGIEG